MENRMKKVGKVSSFLTKYIGVIIIGFSVFAFFWRDGYNSADDHYDRYN